MIDLKEIYKNGKVEIDHYRKGNLWYKLLIYLDKHQILLAPDKYLFPVPISEAGDATFQKEDKASLFLRYIKLAMENKTLIKCSSLS